MTTHRYRSAGRMIAAFLPLGCLWAVAGASQWIFNVADQAFWRLEGWARR